jgi:acetyl esterase/lipase
VEYRLAPETVAPGALEDCYAALRWLHTAADEISVDRTRIAIGGESAGGGLAAALALLARDRGELPICFQLLIYPMLDDRTVTAEARNPFTGQFVWTPSANRFGWTALLGHEPGVADVSPYAAAARASDLSGLPPAYICVGALDLFVDEDIAYAKRLLRAGVPTELHIFPGAYHAFEMAVDAAVTVAAQRERRTALARAFCTARQ